MKQKWKSMRKSTRTSVTSYLAVGIVFLVVELLRRGGGLSSLISGQLIPICAWIVMALSLNLTVGILGELSLGHAGFMSVGAFSGVIVSALLSRTAVPSWLTLLIAMLAGAILAGIVGLLVGIPVLRLRGDYLAIVTLAFGEIIKSIMTNVFIGLDGSGLHFSLIKDNVSAGLDGTGRMLINGPIGAIKISKISTFTAGFLLILVTLFVIYNLMDSKTGRAVMALRDNDIAAEAVGINITKYKLTAFCISACLAGAAGVLFAHGFSTVIASKFDFNTSILVLVFVVLGGLGNMLGSIVAATLLTILPELLRAFSDYRMLVYAVVLILVMLATNNPAMTAYLKKLRKSLTDLFAKRKGGAVHD